MSKRNRFMHDEEGCIGCGACIVECGKHFKWKNDNQKAELINEEIDDEEIDNACITAELCPVNVIHVVDKDGKEVIKK